MTAKAKKRKYDIFHAKKCDSIEILQFIKEHWSENHIFIKHEGLFTWQHLQDETLNFVAARNIEKDTIDAILGYISTQQYDIDLKTNDYWGAIWKIKEGTPPGLGMLLLSYLNNNADNVTYSAIGISEIAKKIYVFLGYNVGHLNHYYFSNTKIKHLEISENAKITPYQEKKSNSVFKEILNLNEKKLEHSYTPGKSIQYLVNRYQNHPIYKYRFFGVYNNDDLLSIWVIRKQFMNSSSCLRIVDMYGSIDEVENLSLQLQDLLDKENSEYIDCLNYGISETKFKALGFENLDFDSETIIPNYFEPFVKKNVKIEFAVNTNYDEYIIFKGDSDQDRPSII